MIIKEYRIILPISLEEYRTAHLWTTSQVNKMETSGGEGFEVLVNEPRITDEGSFQYTHKVIHLVSKVPSVIRALAPRGSLELHQISQNTYPYIKTVVTNPEYMKSNFHVEVKTQHKEDFGETENVHNLTVEELQKREVIYIDFVNDPIDARDYEESEDPIKFVPNASKLGALSTDWLQDMKNGKCTSVPYVCVYKLVHVEFKWFSMQPMVENRIHKFFQRYLLTFNRKLYCWMDKWHGLTMDDIREIEKETKNELEKLRRSGAPRGMFEK